MQRSWWVAVLFLAMVAGDGISLRGAEPGGGAAVSWGLSAEWREYFARADASRTAAIERAEGQIERMEVEWRGASPAAKGPIRRRIGLAQSALEQHKKAKAIADLPLRPKPGEIGHLTEATVLAVLDEKTLVARILAQPMGKGNLETHAILRVESTKGIRAGDKAGYHPAGVWVVSEDKFPDDPKTLNWLPRTAQQNREKLLVLQSVPPGDVARMRTLYDAELKAGAIAGKPAEKKAAE